MKRVILSICLAGVGLSALALAGDEAPPAAAMAPEVEAEPEGRLEVNSKPWSTVWLDGVEWGETPRRARTVTAGLHTLKFECTVCSPARSHREAIVVEQGRTLSLVHRFDDGWTRSRTTPPPEEAVPVAKSPPPMERMLVREGNPSGVLLVNSKPWSNVQLNGYDLGSVPLDVTVTPGEYIIEMACQVCDPQEVRTERVVVSENGTTRLIVVFD